MEPLKLVSLFILVYPITFASAGTDFIVAKSISGILNEHLAKKSPTVEVIVFGKSDTDVVEKVLRNKIDSVAVEVSKYANYQVINLRKPTLLLFDSFESYVEWDKNLYFQPNPRARHPHLIYIHGATVSDIKTLRWGLDGDSTNFLTHDGKKSIKLVAAFFYSPSSCGTSQSAVINRFKSSVMKWEGSTFFPDKFQNFHGCSLNIARGQNCKTFSHFYDILASALNFKLQYFNYSDIHEARSDPKIDLFCDALMADESLDARGAVQVSGTRMLSDELKLIVPLGELLTPLEKMFMPFYFEVWVAILVTFLMALCVIQIINRCTQEVQNAFFDGNNIPTLSLASLFLCGAQRHRPQRSPARFILMMFIIWCLIIRTCYQSELFKCLQSDARKPGVKSVAEIIEQNFTLYGDAGSHWHLSGYTKQQGMAKFNWKEHGQVDFDIVAEPENKAIMVSMRSLATILNIKLRTGVPSFVVLQDEVIWSYHLEFVYRRWTAFKNNFDEKTTQLLESGIVAHRLIALFVNMGKPEIKRKAEIIGPQVLTMEHLEIGFIVWLVPLTFSVLVFAYEVGHRPCKALIRHILEHVRDAIIARSIVLAFIDIRSAQMLPPIRVGKAAGGVDQTTTLIPIRVGPAMAVNQTTLKLETLIEID